MSFNANIKTHLGDFYYADNPLTTKSKVSVFLFLRKLGLIPCQHRVFIANDGSFFAVIKGE